MQTAHNISFAFDFRKTVTDSLWRYCTISRRFCEPLAKSPFRIWACFILSSVFGRNGSRDSDESVWIERRTRCGYARIMKAMLFHSDATKAEFAFMKNGKVIPFLRWEK